MPIFRYKCLECQAEFELLLPRFDSPAECPKCASDKLEKEPSRIGAISSRSGSGNCAMSNYCPSSGGSCCCAGSCGHKH